MKQGYWLRRPPARWLPADGLRARVVGGHGQSGENRALTNV